MSTFYWQPNLGSKCRVLSGDECEDWARKRGWPGASLLQHTAQSLDVPAPILAVSQRDAILHGGHAHEEVGVTWDGATRTSGGLGLEVHEVHVTSCRHGFLHVRTLAGLDEEHLWLAIESGAAPRPERLQDLSESEHRAIPAVNALLGPVTQNTAHEALAMSLLCEIP